ncbi:MAG TPA: DUF1501 domain-containing protein [Polyangia bacterium]|jgi:hypothetical protein
MITRRQGLKTTLLGAGLCGLRALATGLPPSFLLNPRRAFAAGAVPACGSNAKAQYIIFATSGNGDPINASVPGTYEDANIVHSADPAMVATPLTLGGKSTTAAAPWATLPQNVLDRTCFWHLMTGTPVHPEEPNVLKLMGVTAANEMLPSLLARQLAPCLGTIQTQPICMGATSPSEGISYDGAPLPIVPALALKATLTSAPGALTNLQALRDQTMNQLYDLYKSGASPAQQAFVDGLVTSQQQVRSINQSLLDALGSIADNTAASQILAAITLIQMKVSPVISIHIPFGGDNHRDVALGTETAQTVSGVATIASLMQQLAAAGLSDQVTLVSLNVFGRTIGPGNTDGRQHNPNHQVSFTIGKPFKGGVIGGVAPVGGDYGALAIDSKSGDASSSGDVAAASSLAAFGQTMLAAVGVSPAMITSDVSAGKVIAGALA